MVMRILFSIGLLSVALWTCGTAGADVTLTLAQGRQAGGDHCDRPRADAGRAVRGLRTAMAPAPDHGRGVPHRREDEPVSGLAILVGDSQRVRALGINDGIVGERRST